MVVLAPGKLFLAGEYAVTLGQPALVAAVAPWGRTANQTTIRHAAINSIQPHFPDAQRRLGRTIVDTSRFFHQGRKSGFGSSATASCLIAAAHHGIAAPQQLWDHAVRVHESLTGGRGSGGDLAAVIHGGTGIFRITEQGYRWEPCIFPAAARLVLVYSDTPADTRVWLKAFSEAQKTDAFDYWQARLADCVGGFASAEPEHWRKLMDTAAVCYREMRDWLGSALYPPIFEQCWQLGQQLDVPFKPSGAGGGDIGFFYCENMDATARVVSALRDQDIQPTTTRPALRGIHELRTLNASAQD